MAGLLNLVPRYLPAYGMAPRWAAAQRPLVLVFTGLSFLVTLLFRADVEAQGGAYATGVLSLMASASVAVTISVVRSRSRAMWFFIPVTLAFVYITVQNIRSEPNGLLIAAFFVLGIIATSAISRVVRSTELRVSRVLIDRSALEMLNTTMQGGVFRFVTHDPLRGTAPGDYAHEVTTARERHEMEPGTRLMVLEVDAQDPSVFVDEIRLRGEREGEVSILRCEGAAIANTVAALSVALHRQFNAKVHLYMRWTPVDSVIDAIGEGVEFLLYGGGDMARLVELEIRREGLVEEIIVHVA